MRETGRGRGRDGKSEAKRRGAGTGAGARLGRVQALGHWGTQCGTAAPKPTSCCGPQSAPRIPQWGLGCAAGPGAAGHFTDETTVCERGGGGGRERERRAGRESGRGENRTERCAFIPKRRHPMLCLACVVLWAQGRYPGRRPSAPRDDEISLICWCGGHRDITDILV